MNVWQQARQIKYLLNQQTWPAGDPVFSGVLVSAGPKEVGTKRGFRVPGCVINVGSNTADPEHPELITQRWTGWIINSNRGDTLGESSLIGSNRAAATSSLGRGLLEIEERFVEAVGVELAEAGIEVYLRSSGAAQATEDPDLGYVVFRGYDLETQAGRVRTYFPPTRLAATPIGGGSVTLTWTNPPDRFDLYNVVLRRAVGATPPASETAGTGVTLSGPLAVTVTDSPGAGTYSYALFGGYDEVNEPTSTPLVFSSGDTLASVVVT